MPGDEATVEEGSSTSKAHPATGELSCVSCRSRKLRCDRMRPNCTRCAKAGSDCVYPESRRKPAFKRKNVRQLEERLAQVEVLLQRAGEGASTPHGNAPVETEGDVVKTTIGFDIPVAETVFFQGVDYGANLLETDTFPFTSDMAGEFPELSTGLPDNDPMNTAFGRELMELGGITEPLPPFEVMEDLNRLFFQRQQQFAPVIHPARYLHSFYSAPHMKPPMCGMMHVFLDPVITHELTSYDSMKALNT
ncbi:hypothetical protein F5Y18DRAFT_224843 [Xylariaceae sp. FL1019]|nr:hypothetical protein F5Y18DRAFT_224843 [Xylariaceae sp. FL1019]